MLSRRTRRLLRVLLVAICVGVGLSVAFSLNLLWGVQLQSSDFLFKAGNLGESTVPAEEIVVIGIDDKSLEQLGHLPSWPRSYHARVIEVLTEAEARVIVFDVLFSEPAPDDGQLVASVEEAGNVVLPLVYVSTQREVTGLGELIENDGGFVRPLSSLEEAAIAVGHANVLPDGDGVVRKLPIVIDNGGDLEPALALAAVAKYLRRPQILEAPIANGRLTFAGRSIPLDDVNGMLINYVAGSDDAGDTTGFQTVSYVDTLRNEIDPDIFADRIVLIGATASGIGDTFWTPTGRMMYGVDIHANTIHTILTGDFLRPAASGVTVASIMVLALVCGLVVFRLRVLWATLSVILLCVAYYLVAFTSFDRGMMLNMVYPPLAIAGSFVGVNLHNIASERSEKREITKTFGRYISPPVVERILAALDKDELKLGGELTEVTVAFADIRGFTRMSEIVQPEELVRVLNIYLSTVIGEVLKYDGMVNKFAGDSILAIWNAPTRCEGHALMATRAAVEAQRAVKELQESDESLPRIDFSIGINTGKAVAGNLGSEDRSEYSVIGDCVNIASRITGVAEGGKVWIGADTYELVKDYVEAKALEPLVVKGKREPIEAYEVIDVLP
ncbi:MAG: adenylate/guanylate cyclase domain-containing protein [Dehalococcoidia bacterium]